MSPSPSISASLLNWMWLRKIVYTNSCCPPSSCLQNYIPPESLTLSCPVCRQTSILPEKGVCALQNNFFITNLMEVWLLISVYFLFFLKLQVRHKLLRIKDRMQIKPKQGSKDCFKRWQTETQDGESVNVFVSTTPGVEQREDIFVEWGNCGQSFILQEV